MTPEPAPGAQALAERCMRAMLDTDAASAALGIRAVRVAPGQAEMAMTVTAAMLNGHLIGHGGVVFTLADTTFAVACNSYNRNTVATGCDIDFVARGAGRRRAARGRGGALPAGPDRAVRRHGAAGRRQRGGRDARPRREIAGTLVPPD